MARRTRSGFRLAVILLALLCIFLLVVLAACPPASRRAPGARSAPAARPTPPAGSPAGTPSERPSETPGDRPAQGREAAPPATRPEQPRPEVRGTMAVVIDDAGYDLADLQPFLDLPIPLTIAVLPNLPNSREAARRVKAAGKQLIVHMPMEPEGNEDPGPGALRVSHGPDETRRLLESALATVPGAAGMNNHMGSKATADVELMRRVMSFLDERGMFFLDSRTTAATVSAGAAAGAGVRQVERDVFIDAGTTREEIAKAFQAGTERAARTGSAVLIGHVQNPGVLAILRSSAEALREAGVRVSPLTEISR